jgi:Fe-S-cluster containining protein
VSFCETCHIEEKLMQCCGRYPMTGERTPLAYGGKVVYACRHLSAGGLCAIYENRPQGCRDFFCDAYLTGRKKIFNMGAL